MTTARDRQQEYAEWLDDVLRNLSAEMLAGAFPSWRIVATGDRWLAVRIGNFLEERSGPRSLLRYFLDAPDPGRLGDMLSLQTQLDQMSADQLADVYRYARLPESRPGDEQ
jgi:hypothetical protein